MPDALAKRNHFKVFKFHGKGRGNRWRLPRVISRVMFAFNAALPRVFILGGLTSVGYTPRNIFFVSVVQTVSFTGILYRREYGPKSSSSDAVNGICAGRD